MMSQAGSHNPGGRPCGAELRSGRRATDIHLAAPPRWPETASAPCPQSVSGGGRAITRHEEFDLRLGLIEYAPGGGQMAARLAIQRHLLLEVHVLAVELSEDLV